MKPNRKRDLLVIVFCLMLGVASPMFGQPPQPGGEPGRGGPPGFGGPGGPGGFFGGGGLLGLIVRDEVQQELQLVDEQKDKVRGITDEMRNKVRDQMRDMFGQMRESERRRTPGQVRRNSDQDRSAQRRYGKAIGKGLAAASIGSAETNRFANKDSITAAHRRSPAATWPRHST